MVTDEKTKSYFAIDETLVRILIGNCYLKCFFLTIIIIMMKQLSFMFIYDHSFLTTCCIYQILVCL